MRSSPDSAFYFLATCFSAPASLFLLIFSLNFFFSHFFLLSLHLSFLLFLFINLCILDFIYLIYLNDCIKKRIYFGSSWRYMNLTSGSFPWSFDLPFVEGSDLGSLLDLGSLRTGRTHTPKQQQQRKRASTTVHRSFACLHREPTTLKP